MFRTAALGTLGLAAAVGAPIAYYAAGDVWESFRGGSAQVTTTMPGSDATPQGSPGVPWTQSPGGLPLEGAPVERLAEVFRFDVSTGWVMQRWPRVSGGMADLQLQGYRVPLMTGTQPSDLAGSLTYYFSPQQQVQRITFQGTTGDAREIVELVTRQFGFVRRVTNDPGMFVYEHVHPKSRRRSILELRLAQVVKSNQPYRKFDVALSIERPSGSTRRSW